MAKTPRLNYADVANPGLLSAEAQTVSGAKTFSDITATGSINGSGANITAINAGNVASGTLAAARGGTGVTATTGSGSAVLNTNPTFAGTLTAAYIKANNFYSQMGNAGGQVNDGGTFGLSTTPIFRDSVNLLFVWNAGETFKQVFIVTDMAQAVSGTSLHGAGFAVG